MATIKHISCNLFESRVRLTKSEKAHPDQKEGIREYTSPIIQFFALLFGFAVNILHKGQIFCVNKKSFKEWVDRNLETAARFDAIASKASGLITEVKFAALKKEISGLPSLPAFVLELCKNTQTEPHYPEVKAWKKAYEVLALWARLALILGVAAPVVAPLESAQAWIEKSKEFGDWFELHKEKFIKVKFPKMPNVMLKGLPKQLWKEVNLYLSFAASKTDFGKMEIKPIFIQKILGKSPTNELLQEVNTWWKARDTLHVWLELAKTIKADIPYLDGFKSIPEWVEKAEEFPAWFKRHREKLATLTILQFNDMQLKEIPKEIGQLVNLERLDLGKNQLKELPNELGNLCKLKILNIYHNLITEMPKAVLRLKSLEKLSLSSNYLKTLPQGIKNLEKLEYLFLSHNWIKELPKEIGFLKSLRDLYISHNELGRLPREIAGILSLVSLDITDNPIKSLPEGISDLPHLKHLFAMYTPNLKIPEHELKKIEEKVGKISI